MPTVQLAGQYLFLDNISWATYERLLREAGERHIRMTYDSGDLEIMTLSFGHENSGELIGRLISMLTFQLVIPIRSGGSTTLRRKLKRKGLEPDKCYWIKNEKAMREKTRWDAKTDPPPDLAVEVEVSRSSMNRMGIYGALRIPEVWRYKSKKLRVYLLGEDGEYHESQTSSIFPYLDMAKVNEFLQSGARVDETTLLREFAEWVRKEIVPLVADKNVKNGRRSEK